MLPTVNRIHETKRNRMKRLLREKDAQRLTAAWRADSTAAAGAHADRPGHRLVARILIVDDAPRNCILFEALMEAEGYVAVSVGSGVEALAQVARQPPDLILLDIMMPDMSGYDVAKILKADPATADIPLIMATARVEPGARLAALEAGAEHFLMKPVDPAELSLTIRNLLRLKAPNPAHFRFV